MKDARLSVTFRALHWSIAFIVFLNAFVFKDGKYLHRYLGYTAFAFILMRIFIRKRRLVPHYNSKVKYVYWSIWTCVSGLALSGFLMGLDRFWGNQTLEDIHEIISSVLLAFVCIHLIGIFFDAFLHKRKTWMIMIDGKKK